MTDHIVSAFSDELERLSADILRMGGIAEAMITDSCSAVATVNHDLARAVILEDDTLDALEADVEKRIMRLLALRQPMASDLRVVLSAFKVSHELERIGDLSKNNAGRTIELGGADAVSAIKGILRMGKSVSRQLQSVLDAYSSADEALAERVWSNDEDIDQHYNSLFREMLTYMMEDPRLIGPGAHLMFIAKNLERIGDHCTNIAEVVHFQVTGHYLDADARPKAPLIES
ncbi:MAG: phosphate signaling complex protein PhoU [Pseudomonadota bacterium]